MRTIWKYLGVPYKMGDTIARKLIDYKYVHIVGKNESHNGTTWTFGHKINDDFGQLVDRTVSFWQDHNSINEDGTAFNGNTKAVAMAQILFVPASIVGLILVLNIIFGLY